jgi:hypothetical protein
MIEQIPIQGLLRSLLSKLPKLFLRRHFTAEKLAGLIYVDIKPRHESVTINLSQGASFTLWIQVINLSPFDLELDRANFVFWCGSARFKTSILKRQIIAPGEIVSLHIEDVIPDGYAQQIAKSSESRMALEGNMEFNCKVRSFAKNIGHLDGINARILNANFYNKP